MAKKKVQKPARFTVFVHEDEVAKLSAQALLQDGFEPRDGVNFSEYEKALYIGTEKGKSQNLRAVLVRQHHRWTGKNKLQREWSFIFEAPTEAVS